MLGFSKSFNKFGFLLEICSIIASKNSIIGTEI